MVEEQGGWFVKNVADAMWFRSPDFGRRCIFEDPAAPFTDIGVNIAVVEPGRPACKYHRESAQENFIVLSGECLLLVNGEEKQLRPGDFVHCPAGVSHVFIGAGDRPCAILMIGHRPDPHRLFYPANDLAQAHGAESPEPTPDPRVAYADCGPREASDAMAWPDIVNDGS